MKTERMNNNFRFSLFRKTNPIYASDEGLTVECPLNGYYCVYDINSGNLNEYHKTETIIEKKKIFGKHNDGKFVIYYFSNGFIKCKGFTNKMFFDTSFGGWVTEINISYDYEIKIAAGRSEQFIDFISSNNIPNEASSEKYESILNNEINKNIRGIFGEKLKENSTLVLENSNSAICKEVITSLNSSDSNLYNYGLEVLNFSFGFAESYVDKEEKKRIIRDKFISDLKR